MASGFMQRFKGKVVAQLMVISSPTGQQLQSVQTGIVASVTQSQAGGTPLTAMACFVSTCATLGNALTLPIAVPGMELSIIVQAAATAPTVYPTLGQTINALSANTGLSIPVQTITMFYCGVAGAWWTK